MGLARILEAIYEQDFLDFSYGFRPNRSCHDALRAINKTIIKDKINYIVDADIKGFFNNVDHEWMMKFIGHRIANPNIKRLIVRFLKAGIMERGRFEATDKGTAQGSVVSPILANIYLHHYYGITDNYPMLQQFKYEVIKILFKWLNRRSQRRSFTKEKFQKYLRLNPLPNPKIYVNIMG